MENKKDVIKTLVIIILLLVVVAMFIIPIYIEKVYLPKHYESLYGAQYLQDNYNNGYQTGINDAVIQLAIQQTNSSNVLLVYNNSLQAFPLSTLCQGVQG